MDSSLYKHLIEELLNGPKKGFSSLPIHFIRPPQEESVTAFQSLELFLSDRIASLQRFKENFFSQLFFISQKALLEIIQGSDTNTHSFRSNGVQLLKFLTYCAFNGIPAHFCEENSFSLAMMCFLLEGLTYCGWCPDSFEGTAKRAAHEYCITLKKSLHHLKKNTTGAVLGYLWGAWLFAQKTEGIRVVREISLPSMQTFQWNLGGINRAYIVEKSVKPAIFYILSKSYNRLPHPFTTLSNDNLVGLYFFIDREPIFSNEIVEYSEINRIKKHGHKFIFNCATKASIGFRWTIVFLKYESTFYRIDLLIVPENIKTITISAELCLETKATLKKIGKNAFWGKGVDNTIVEFVENPLELSLDGQLDDGRVKFKSGQKNVSGLENVTIVTAWAQGKGISAINKTHLLGIYD